MPKAESRPRSVRRTPGSYTRRTLWRPARAYAIQRFARDLLGVAVNLQRALAAAPAGSADAGVQGLVAGLELTEKSLLQAFESNGLTRVAPEPGERFDPNVHQAMAEQPSTEVQGGCVMQTYQPGYVLFGRTIRPAMVVVAAKGSGPKSGYGAEGGEEAGASVDTKACHSSLLPSGEGKRLRTLRPGTRAAPRGSR